MNLQQIIAIILIIGGALGLAYGGFTYTKETHDVSLGPIEMSFDEKERVNIPIWAGIGMLTIGGILLVSNRKS
jgi:drug/metabolite transporter (DMT)-like permease